LSQLTFSRSRFWSGGFTGEGHRPVFSRKLLKHYELEGLAMSLS